MNAFWQQVRLGIALSLRNRMALIYGFVFPLIFLASFWAIYRFDKIPLASHMGELLTVTVLGGACFGLPTTMVSERERGVWRRYRLAPLPLWSFVGSTLTVRFILLLAAALLQLAVAMAIGMPPPSHPLGLLVTFAFVCIAFLGLGVLIAMLANTVPAVQALGQCIFLPMLMIGGVAVRLSSLPEWAVHASAFFPGRYAVEALQASVTGDGLANTHFELVALLLMGVAAGLAAARLFRWDAGQKGMRARGSKVWLAIALGLWLSIGAFALWDGRVALASAPVEEVPRLGDYVRNETRAALAPAAPERAGVSSIAAPVTQKALVTPKEQQIASAPTPVAPAATPTWRDVTPAEIDNVAFERLPTDTGLISPIARPGDVPSPTVAAQIETARAALATWPPAQVEDPVQRVRNILYVAATADVLRMEELERHLPLIVYEHLQRDLPRNELVKLLYWVATHPDEGDDAAIQQLEPLGLPTVSGPSRTARARVMLYAFKLLGRLTGDIAVSGHANPR